MINRIVVHRQVFARPDGGFSTSDEGAFDCQMFVRYGGLPGQVNEPFDLARIGIGLVSICHSLIRRARKG